jgi:hypothetical protein
MFGAKYWQGLKHLFLFHLDTNVATARRGRWPGCTHAAHTTRSLPLSRLSITTLRLSRQAVTMCVFGFSFVGARSKLYILALLTQDRTWSRQPYTHNTHTHTGGFPLVLGASWVFRTSRVYRRTGSCDGSSRSHMIHMMMGIRSQAARPSRRRMPRTLRDLSTARPRACSTTFSRATATSSS